ncbi:MAG: hypothetical protein H5U40_16035, partial [Polyangiaceae bacterium]|nr:hypothetical protein [Polyangiaceae bacterium]
GACFRAESLPLIVLITDAPMHDGPPGIAPVSPYRFDPSPHDYAEALAALRAIDARVIGIGPTDRDRPSPMPHLRAIARDTGTVDGRDAPLAFDVGELGAGVDQTVVDAVRTLAESLPLDVDAVVEDVPGDALDARELIVAVRPISAEPPSSVERIDGDSFIGVRPGTRLVFELVVDASRVPSADDDVRVPAEVRFRAFERSTIERVRIELVLVGRDGAGCNP